MSLLNTPEALDTELRQPGRVLVFTDDTGPPVQVGRLRVLVSITLSSEAYPALCMELKAIRDRLGVAVLHGKEIRGGRFADDATRLAAYRDWCRCLVKHAKRALFTHLNDIDPEIKTRRQDPAVQEAVPPQGLGLAAMLAAVHHKVVLGEVRASLLADGRNGSIVSVEDASKPQKGRVTLRPLRDMQADAPTDPPLIVGHGINKADDEDIDGLQLADLAAHSLTRLLYIRRNHIDMDNPDAFDPDELDDFDRVFWDEIHATEFSFESVHKLIEETEPVTQTILEAAFGAFDRDYFGARLRGGTGVFLDQRMIDHEDGATKKDGSEIYISPSTQHEWRKTLIHEMVHAFEFRFPGATVITPEGQKNGDFYAQPAMVALHDVHSAEFFTKLFEVIRARGEDPLDKSVFASYFG